jgi:phenylalanyl-tRNA synthetase beta chain
MKFSYTWLQSLVEKPLPAPDSLSESITFHSSEVEEIIATETDTVFDVKVLPDKSAWLMSHRGLAKELSVILANPLKNDLFVSPAKLENFGSTTVTLATDTCDYYSAALVTGVTVGPSPEWLKDRLAALGQRSINNIVDATNYVMFELGQPLHAFDADKLAQVDGHHQIVVRAAKPGETIVTLTGEEYTLSVHDALIVDGGTDTPVGIAGVKGGIVAAVDAKTTNLLIESAHFNRFAIRKTAKNLKLQTDASKRYENGISRGVAPIALTAVLERIREVAGGQVVGATEAGDASVIREPVAVPLAKINSVLGLTLSREEVEGICTRFGYVHSIAGDILTLTPPFERDDLVVPEDIIEEIGRMHGMHHIVSVPPEPRPLSELNTRHYYAEKIRAALMTIGFSEVYTSSFRAIDEVALENALATDKGYLRSALTPNLEAARQLNVPHRDLLGLLAVKLFEIGTVFNSETEEFRVGLTVQTGTSYKAKVDDPLITGALSAIEAALGVLPEFITHKNGSAEFSLDKLVSKLPPVVAYEPVSVTAPIKYRPFSLYPAMSRDIAMWVETGVTAEAVLALLLTSAGLLCVRVTHLDTFSKDGRTSLAFRLVFQSPTKTLTDDEVNAIMAQVYETAAREGWEVR